MSNMATTCNACGKSIHTLDYMECKTCKHLYDLECLNISLKYFQESSDQYKLNWICPICLAGKPKRDNSCTPVRNIGIEKPNNTYTKAENTNINTVRGSRNLSPACDGPENDSGLVSEIRQLRFEIAELKHQSSQISLLRAEVQELKTQLANIPTSVLQRLADFETVVELKDKEITLLNSTVRELQSQMSLQEQFNMRNELEIHGVTELERENLQHIVNLTSKKYGVDLSDADIDGVWRVGPRTPRNSNNMKKDWKPRPIVVKLLRRAKRDELIKAAKSRRNVTTENIVASNPSKISMYERLSKSSRSLFRDARLRIKQHHFSYCWVLNGVIYVRKAEGAPTIPIRSHQDLNERVGEDTNERPPDQR